MADTQTKSRKIPQVEIRDKMLVTSKELAALTGIGLNRLEDKILLIPEVERTCVVHIGAHKKIKVDAFREWLRNANEL